MKHFVQVMTMCAAVLTATVLTGCTNWKDRYNSLEVEHQNLRGLYENCVTELDGTAAEQSQLNQQLQACESELSSLKQQASTSDTGFRVGEVAVDEDAGTITVTLPNAILFPSGKSALKSATSSELDHIYGVLRERYSGKTIDVVGHTDTDPIRKTKDLYKDNWDLSAERSLSVLRYLVDRGVQPSKIRGVACGESRPVASNSTAAGKAKNRRVEIVVHTR